MDNAESYILSEIKATLENSNITDRSVFIKDLINAEKIFIYGVGRSGLVAKSFAIRLVQLGLQVYFIGETITPIVEPGDLVIILSNTGETMSAIQTANIVGRVGAKVVVITANEQSKLAHTASIVIHLNINIGKVNSRLAPLGTIFEDTAHIFLDGIISDVMKDVGENEKKMRSRHAIWV